jgi:tetratricopeptide (TPR) repeat protein
MRAAALKAVQLDDSLAEGHAVLGAYMHVYEWDSEAAEREQLRAIALDPSYLTARYFYGNLLRSHGRIEEALAQYNAATELDPLDPLLRENLGRTLMLAGRFDEAREHFDSALELDSTFWRLHTGLGLYFETTGRLEDALGAYRRAYELAGERNTDIARMLARLGEEQEARRIVRELEQQAARTALHDPDVATVLLALDDLEGALDWLERSFGERHPQLRFIAGDPTFKPFEVEPRYMELLRRIGVRR